MAPFSQSVSMKEAQIKNICCIGAGFVGGPTAAVLAANIEDITVTVVDRDPRRIEAWNSQHPPVAEAGLQELLDLCRDTGGKPSHGSQSYNNSEPSSIHHPGSGLPGAERRRNLRFTTDIDSGIRDADMIFLCVDTPQAGGGGGRRGSAPDITNLERAVRRIGEVAVKNFIIVEKCTVPCGTAQRVHGILSEALSEEISYEILSNPEFLAEGTAIRDLSKPDRVLIGSSLTTSGLTAARRLADLYETWIPKERILTIDTWSAELSKLCANALLAQRISSINSFSMICEKIGADIRNVSQAVGLDHRIGPEMLAASVGFGGSCFQKDIAHLVYLASSLGLEDVACYWDSVLEMNEFQKDRFSHRISSRLSSLSQAPGDTVIAVFGFAFKAGTNDSRNSAAVKIVQQLLDRRYRVQLYDPGVPDEDILGALRMNRSALEDQPSNLTLCSSPYQACGGANAVVILTEWHEFRYQHKQTNGKISNGLAPINGFHKQVEVKGHRVAETNGAVRQTDAVNGDGPGASTKNIERRAPVNWEHVADLMKAPRYLFDGRNVVDDEITRYGFNLERVGKSSQQRSPF